MRDGRWEMEDERWKMGRCEAAVEIWVMQMGDGRWEMGDGRWEMGDGRWAMRDGR